MHRYRYKTGDLLAERRIEKFVSIGGKDSANGSRSAIFLSERVVQKMSEALVLRNVSDLKNYAIHAEDGNIGHLKDCYIDDESWIIRHLVVDIGGWPMRRKILISPFEIGMPNDQNRELPVTLTREQIKSRPNLRAQTMAPIRDAISFPKVEYAVGITQRQDGRRLRSCREITNDHIRAIDGDIGHLKGMLVDIETWTIRYLIVNIGNWWLGHQTLIAPRWIKAVSCQDAYAAINLTRQTILDAPSYDWTEQLSPEQDKQIQEHYNVSSRWINEVARKDFVVRS
jgi:hypothetical protein